MKIFSEPEFSGFFFFNILIDNCIFSIKMFLSEIGLGENYALSKQDLVDFGIIFDRNYHYNVSIFLYIPLDNGCYLYICGQKHHRKNSWDFGYNMCFFRIFQFLKICWPTFVGFFISHLTNNEKLLK
ncbi:hypothetical protein BLM37_00370 [Candidatus Gracilibacteria bacterium GN02-873]|nr:hypothetical protein BLM37_00370 [Candidatus Gracilibacteria bacterium GN02-873]